MYRDIWSHIMPAHKSAARAIDFQFWTRVSDQIAGSGWAITERAHNKKVVRGAPPELKARDAVRVAMATGAKPHRRVHSHPLYIMQGRPAGDAQHTQLVGRAVLRADCTHRTDSGSQRAARGAPLTLTRLRNIRRVKHLHRWVALHAFFTTPPPTLSLSPRVDLVFKKRVSFRFFWLRWLGFRVLSEKLISPGVSLCNERGSKKKSLQGSILSERDTLAAAWAEQPRCGCFYPAWCNPLSSSGYEELCLYVYLY
jgi:hypothetical protein